MSNQVDHRYIQVILMVTELEIALLFSPARPSATFGFTRRGEKRSRIVAFTLRDVATGKNVHEMVRRGRRPFGNSRRVCFIFQRRVHRSASLSYVKFTRLRFPSTLLRFVAWLVCDMNFFTGEFFTSIHTQTTGRNW